MKGMATAHKTHPPSPLALASVVVVMVLLALLLSPGTVYAFELQGSQLYTLERSDAGELYAAMTIVLDLALTRSFAVVLLHEQAVEGFQAFTDRKITWDAGVAWRPADDFSIGVGRRWIDRRGRPPDGPWTYIQVWKGI